MSPSIKSGVDVVFAPICNNLLRLDEFLGAIRGAFAAYLCAFLMHFARGFPGVCPRCRGMRMAAGCGRGLRFRASFPHYALFGGNSTQRGCVLILGNWEGLPFGGDGFCRVTLCV